MKRLSTILAAGMVLLLASCSGGGKEENKTADTTAAAAPAKPAFQPFKLMMVTHPVKDFPKWKAAFLAHDSVRKVYGISPLSIGRELADSNNVIVINMISDIQKTKEFAALPELKEVMKKGGVVGPPTFDYVEVVRADTSNIPQKDRLMIAHKVKDYNAWLKVFDGEGTATRAGFGMIDRGIARGIDDSNMVYVLFAISDMAKAKARGDSPVLKKIMDSAGVISKPVIHFYKVVE
ncbi:MAG: hypothetical protein ABUT20_57790 [Bacteroidota bacterium]